MRVVEFVGPPGAGKSRLIDGTIRGSSEPFYEPQTATLRWARTASPRLTRTALRAFPADLARKVTNRLLARGYFTQAALERFRARHAEFLDTTLDVVRRRRDAVPESDLLRGWITGLAARYQLASEGLDPAAVLLLEEGFGTRAVGLFSFGWEAAAMPDLTRYAMLMPTPDVVVLVDTPVETCRQRLEARGWTRRTRGLPEAQKIAYLTNAGEVARLLVEQLGARGAEIAAVRGETPDDVHPALRSILGALDRAKTAS